MPKAPLQHVSTLGIDIGKNRFHLIGLDAEGTIDLRQKLSRRQVEQRLANMPTCLIDMVARCPLSQPSVARMCRNSIFGPNEGAVCVESLCGEQVKLFRE